MKSNLIDTIPAQARHNAQAMAKKARSLLHETALPQPGAFAQVADGWSRVNKIEELQIPGITQAPPRVPGLKYVVFVPTPCQPCAALPFAVVISVERDVRKIAKIKFLADVRSIGVQQQAGRSGKAPAQAQQRKIVGAGIERVGVGVRFGMVEVSMPNQGIEAQRMLGGEIIVQLHVSVFKGNVRRGIAATAPVEIIQVALARGDQP